MKLGKIITFIPAAFLSFATKIPKFNIDNAQAEKILKEGLYHFTANEDLAKKIIESQYLKPSSRFTSYDISKWCFLFAGKPDLELYMKNITRGESNPLIYPNIIVDAIKFIPDKEDLKNYRSRLMNDDVIMYQGKCNLPINKVSEVRLVPDLKRAEDGSPIKDEDGEYSVEFREVDKSEIIEGTNRYKAKEDYLQFIKEKASDLNYRQFYSDENKNKFEKGIIKILNSRIKRKNSINNLFDVGFIENKYMVTSIQKNWKNILKEIKNKITGIFKSKEVVEKVEPVETVEPVKPKVERKFYDGFDLNECSASNAKARESLKNKSYNVNDVEKEVDDGNER